MERSIKTSPSYCYERVQCHCQWRLCSQIPWDEHHLVIGGIHNFSYTLNDDFGCVYLWLNHGKETCFLSGNSSKGTAHVSKELPVSGLEPTCEKSKL